jgi:hypothetical protein
MCNKNETATNFTAKSGADGQINLSWSYNTIPDIYGVLLQRALGTSGSFVNAMVWRPTVDGTPFPTTYNDTGQILGQPNTGLLSGQTYQYRLQVAVQTPGPYTYGPYTPVLTVTTAKTSTPVLTATSSDPSTVNLSWTDSDSGIASYSVLASTTSGIITVASTSATTNSYTISNLSPNTKYCYYVQAVVNPVNNATSSIACATTQNIIAPTSLSVTSYAYMVGQIILSWDNNGATSFQGVSIERSTLSATSGYTQIALVPSNMSYIDTVTPYTAYWYRIRILYNSGLYSSYVTASTSVQTIVVAPVMANPTASSTSVNLQIIDSNRNVQFTVNEKSPASTTVPSIVVGTTTQLIHWIAVNNLLPNTNYCFTAFAKYQASDRQEYNSVESIKKCVTTLVDITPPVISNISVTGIYSNGVILSWMITWLTDEPSDSQVYYGLTSAYGNNTSLNSTLTVAHTETLSGLMPGTTYHYQVRSRDASGNLATSSDMTFTTPPIVIKSSATYKSSSTYQSSSTSATTTKSSATYQASSTSNGAAVGIPVGTDDIWTVMINWFENLFGGRQ